MANFGDIQKKVKTYEDAARYYFEFKNKLYAEEIKSGEAKTEDVYSPVAFALHICRMAEIRKYEDDINKKKFWKKIEELNDRLDRIEDLLDELEER